jgi:hypothetical protein
LAPESRWSDQVFRPEHLFKLFTLEASSVTEKVVQETFAPRCVTCAERDRKKCERSHVGPPSRSRPALRSLRTLRRYRRH